MKRHYPEKTLVLDFRGDDWNRKNPHLGVYHDYDKDPNYAGVKFAPGAQHGTSTVLYPDMPGARLWWFVIDYHKEFDAVQVYE